MKEEDAFVIQKPEQYEVKEIEFVMSC